MPCVASNVCFIILILLIEHYNVQLALNFMKHIDTCNIETQL